MLLFIGKSSLRGISTPQDYFICGHQVTLPFCVCTFTGTWLSAITILSLTGSIYENGLASLSYSVIPWFLGAFLMALIARKIHRAGVVTVPEYFRTRFGSRRLQAVYGAVFIFVYVSYLVTQFKGFDPSSKILSVKKDGGDIDAITASTITSRAYSLAVKNAVEAFKTIKEEYPTAAEAQAIDKYIAIAEK